MPKDASEERKKPFYEIVWIKTFSTFDAICGLVKKDNDFNSKAIERIQSRN